MNVILPQIQSIHKTNLGKLLDLGSIRDIGQSHGEAFDGVYCGIAACGKQDVVFIMQDYSFKGGSCGITHSLQIAESIQTAIDMKVPLLMFMETGGARIQDGQSTLEASGKALYLLSKASGYIPTIAVIMGTCAGIGAYYASICDCAVFISGKSHIFMTGPKVVSAAIGKKIDKEILGDTDKHAIQTGITTHIARNTEHAQEIVRQLLNLLPPYCGTNAVPRMIRYRKNGPGKDEKCSGILPKNDRATYDMNKLINAVVDDGSYSEFFPQFARNLLTGLGTLSGRTVGIVANQPKFLSGAMDVKGAAKLTRFIQICDAYNIPLVFLVDCPGFLPGDQQESLGSVNYGGKAAHMLRSCQTAKITVVVRRLIGGAYAVMNSVPMGSDCVLAWPEAEIAIMGIVAANQVSSHNHADNLQSALELGMVKKVIQPSQTRKELVKAINTAIQKKKECGLVKRRIILPM